jgi:pimeloyl-ACP methyl ester carboxylesterase
MHDRDDAPAIRAGFFADVHGSPQWLAIHGADLRNPVLLIVGGPGFAGSAAAPYFAPWARDFTVVSWDQPGSGATFGRSGEPVALTVERLVADGLRVAEIAAQRVGARRVAVLAMSGGTIVGLRMVQREPALFSAYVGSGQFVNFARQDAASHALLLELARERRDAAMLAELEAIGPPPYADAATDARKSRYAGAPTEREAAAWAELVPLLAAAARGAPRPWHLAPDVTYPEPRARALAVYTALRADIVSFDARQLSKRFAVPMFFFQGAEDLYSVSAEVERYAAEIEAPAKGFVAVRGAGHSAGLLREELGEFLRTRVFPGSPARE